MFERSRVDDTTVKIVEKSYGGDSLTQRLDIQQALSALSLPGSPEYAIERRYQYGGPKLVQYLSCDGFAPFLTIESNTLDPGFGLVVNSTDKSGAVSSFTWDVLGRIKSYTPQREAATSYEYSPATGSSGPQVTVTRGSGPTVLGQIIIGDGFGRVAETRSQIPDRADGSECGSDNCWNTQINTYRSDGQLEESSVAMFKNSSDTIGWRRNRIWYDALGRRVATQAPDNSKITYLHFGRWHVQETIPTLGARDLYYDRHGRLVKVTEGSGAPYRYEYDSSSRLVDVKAIGSYDDPRASFEYDNRGFLFREYHPELGVYGIRYDEYDSRGNVLLKTFPNEASSYDLQSKYDGAERITEVIRGDKVIKSFTYHPSSKPMAGGKMATATRLNIVPTPGNTLVETEHTVVNKFEYRTETGRLHTSEIIGAPNGFSALTTYGYDSLGQLTSMRYPDTCAAANPCSRLITTTYRNGLPRSISGFVSGVNYFPNGMMRKRTRPNNTETIQHLHPDQLGTPRAITSASGGLVLRRDYFPFGEETFERTTAGRLEFTGHERDDDGTLMSGGDLDYMHARYYTPALGRFLSVDPAPANPAAPATWNRFSYARNNPVVLLDPDGRQEHHSGAETFGHVVHKVMLVEDVPFILIAGSIGVTAGGLFDVFLTPFRVAIPQLEEGMERQTGKPYPVFPMAQEVEKGVVQVFEKTLGRELSPLDATGPEPPRRKPSAVNSMESAMRFDGPIPESTSRRYRIEGLRMTMGNALSIS